MKVVVTSRNSNPDTGKEDTYEREVLPTPFSSLLSSMTIKYCEEALASDATKWNHYGMRILHEPSGSFGVSHGTFEGKLWREVGIAASSNGDILRYRCYGW